MFRATEIGSEESEFEMVDKIRADFQIIPSLHNFHAPLYAALPALAEFTQADYEAEERRDIEWGGWRAEGAKLKRPQRSSLPNYGFAPPPIRMEYRYPRAVFFVLATKFFEAFAANGIRSESHASQSSNRA